MAYENAGLRRCQVQNCFIVKIIQTGGLGSLKVDPRFATQRRVDYDPLQVVVPPETEYSMLRQILR